ncbi:tRNA dihydrouridine synthase [Crateriforma conspicua]|uniref:tRNA-dihydrouridine synthase n=1 Tax=Crateriforma conspicua TaxID=2527996 RepID=A0A5C5XTD0_9PLAN|nr:tRNA-dihydrouridine synthase [Crateriforma conspicua]QDV61034.1 tRNA-dihydrouridine synthase C [Crateriforma conspicua]TWT65869.1 tRNA-dihydrouridine synthase C [Crateriforma conspicua]
MSPSVQLRPLKIGNVSIGFPVVQAALSGYSDLPMRVIARRHGASYTICEVMLDQFLLALQKRQKTKHFLDIHPSEPPVGGQLMGAEPEQFSAGAAKMVEAGFDIIDVNFGCPVKKVLGRCRGGFHLSQPKVAIEILRRTRDVVPDSIPVTVKMRRGIDDSQQSRDHFFEIMDGAISAGLAAATVHGRTVEQRYIGPSRWEFLTEVKQHVGDRIKILGSGDLFAAEDALRMIDQTGIDGVTVARGAIGNPWIFKQALALAAGKPLPDPPRLHRQASVMRDHFSLCESTYTAERAPLLMRKFCIKYSQCHPNHDVVRLAFARLRSREQFEEVLAEHYAEDLAGRYVPREVHGSQAES